MLDYEAPETVGGNENPGVAGVTRVAANNDGASSGNREICAGVTGVADLLENAADPCETPPPEGTQERHVFPLEKNRPRWGCYEDWCEAGNKSKPGVYFHGMTRAANKHPRQPMTIGSVTHCVWRPPPATATGIPSA